MDAFEKAAMVKRCDEMAESWDQLFEADPGGGGGSIAGHYLSDWVYNGVRPVSSEEAAVMHRAIVDAFARMEYIPTREPRREFPATAYFAADHADDQRLALHEGHRD